TLSALIKRFAAANAPEVSATSLAALVTAPEGQSTLAVEPESESSQSASSDGSTSTAGKGRLYYRQAAKWMAEVADALHYAHCAGVIHRDVKPSNLIFSTDGRGVMVADFGLAKVVGDESVTLTGSLIGTYQYMSPEQVGAKRVRVDARTDIYSLGATLYELLAFKPAFKRAHTPEEREDLLGKILFKDPTPPRKIVPAVPIELQNICLKAMEKSPDSRYASAKELAEDLRRYIDDLPIVARSPSLVRRTTKFIRRHRTATAIALVIALAASAIGYFRHSAQQDQQRRVEALIAQGTSHLAGENWQSAEEVFGEVLDEDPGNLHALFNLAIAKKSLFYDSGEPSLLDEADALLTRSLEVAPGNARIWDFKGIILRNRGRLDDAVASHRKSLDFDDSPYSTWINLGLALALKGDLSSAEDALRRGVELCAAKCGPMPPRTLAAVQLQLDMPEASATIAQALEASGADVPSLLLRARLRLQDGEHFDVSGARDDALAADRLSHGADPLAKRLIGLAWISAEQWHDAIAAAKAALSLGDPPSPAHLILAIAYAHLGSADLAKQHYDTAVNHWPANLTERGDFVPRADGSVLWIESAEEWLQLRRQAEALIQAK
ncbi:MAG: protein kinase, partial [Phycisphaerae bacterium]